MRITLKTINNELAKRGYTARLAKAASGYFYFESGEAADCLDKTVNVPKREQPDPGGMDSGI
jgi:hypothetical protein